MRIFLTGATGFIGKNIARILVQEGHELTCLARDTKKLPAAHNITALAGEFLAPTNWLAALAGQEVLINCVGIIREKGDATFARVHNEIPCRLFETAARLGIKKIIQISAMGAAEAAVSRYYTSKYSADQFLTLLPVDYVILRPSVVYGPGDRSMALFEWLACLPIVPVPGDGEYLLQPIFVADLARAVACAVAQDEIKNVTVEAGGASPLAFNRLLDELARVRGCAPRKKFHIPWRVMEITAQFTDYCGFGPITSEELAMLRRGNYGDIAPFEMIFGFTPLSVATGLKLRAE